MTEQDRLTAPWRKSSRSGGNGDCVEVAPVAHPAGVLLRDSTDPDGPRLEIPPECWTTFLRALTQDGLDTE